MWALMEVFNKDTRLQLAQNCYYLTFPKARQIEAACFTLISNRNSVRGKQKLEGLTCCVGD